VPRGSWIVIALSFLFFGACTAIALYINYR
jgi:hypothetical protein